MLRAAVPVILSGQRGRDPMTASGKDGGKGIIEWNTPSRSPAKAPGAIPPPAIITLGDDPTTIAEVQPSQPPMEQESRELRKMLAQADAEAIRRELADGDLFTGS